MKKTYKNTKAGAASMLFHPLFAPKPWHGGAYDD